MRQSWKLLTVTGPGVRIPLSPQKETHNIVVGFLFSKKSQTCLRFFLENKKHKILLKNLGFYACSGFLSGTHAVNLDVSEKRKRQNSCKEFGFLWVFWIPFWDARSESLFLRKPLVNHLILKCLFFKLTEELTVIPFKTFFISIFLRQIIESF